MWYEIFGPFIVILSLNLSTEIIVIILIVASSGAASPTFFGGQNV